MSYHVEPNFELQFYCYETATAPMEILCIGATDNHPETVEQAWKELRKLRPTAFSLSFAWAKQLCPVPNPSQSST